MAGVIANASSPQPLHYKRNVRDLVSLRNDLLTQFAVTAKITAKVKLKARQT